jgi:hypothetical protein
MLHGYYNCYPRLLDDADLRYYMTLGQEKSIIMEKTSEDRL